MVQAARSGKQNIAEGYLEKSLKMYIKLLGVARASLGELLEDYEDFARQNKVSIWSIEKAGVMREIRDIRELTAPDHPYIPDLPLQKEASVNLLITLTNQACYLLDRQNVALEEKFIKEGGYSENLFKRRLAQKNSK
jgi:four helix bundle suffix protein